MDLSALAGASADQVALIARLLRSGQLQVPLDVNQPGQSSVPISANDASLGSAVTENHNDEQVSAEKEDGELEEGEVGESDPSERGFLRPPPLGPRAQGNGSRDRQERSRGEKSPKPSTVERPTTRGSRGPVVPVADGARGFKPESRSAEAKAFVLQLHASGYSFADIARHVGDTLSLRRVFHELGLPSERLSPESTSKPVGSNPTVPQIESPQMDPPDSGEARKRPALPTKAAPVNRNEYLARLAAAKSKSTPAMSSVPPTPVEATSNAADGAVIGVTPTQTPTPKSPAIVKPTYRRELVMQKMEALMAERAAIKAAKQVASSISTGTDERVDQVSSGTTEPGDAMSKHSISNTGVTGGLGAGLINISSRVTKGNDSLPSLRTRPVSQDLAPAATPTRETSSPVQGGVPLQRGDGNGTPLSARPLGRLPGLFMTSLPPVQPNVTKAPEIRDSATSPDTLNLHRKRSFPEESTRMEAVSSTNHAKRPFGSGRHQSPEHLVTEVTEDERDGEEDMDIDMYGSSSASDAEDTSENRDSSAASLQAANPGTLTPSAVETSEYQRKMEEIEEVKRIIAQKERAKMNVKGSRAPSIYNASPAILPKESQMATSNDAPPTPFKGSDLPQPVSTPSGQTDSGTMMTIPFSRPRSTVAAARQEEKAKLQLQLEKLQKNLQQYSRSPSRTTNDAPNIESKSQPQEAGISSLAPSGGSIERDSRTGIPLRLAGVETEQVKRAEVVGDHRSASSQNGAGSKEPSADTSHIFNLNGKDDVELSDGEVVENSSPIVKPTPTHQQLPNMEEFAWSENAGSGPSNPGTDSAAVESDASDGDEMDESEESNDAVSDVSHGGDNSSNRTQDEQEDGGEHELELELEVEDGDGFGSSTSTHEDMSAERGAPSVDLEETKLRAVNDASLKSSSEGVSAEQPTQKSYFTPYQSPLKRFQDYKYHPEYLNSVSDGFNSLTYNHRIDPTKFICPYEATGGRCNDKNCEHQHFQSLRLSDNDLLKSLISRKAPDCDVKQDQEWRDGLAVLIKQLRSASLGQDASAIAVKIAQYRRDFAGDATKMVNFA